MAQSKDDIKYATAQARHSEDEGVRVAYVHGTPLEGGKIAESAPVDLYSSAHSINKSSHEDQSAAADANSQTNTRAPAADSSASPNKGTSA